MWVVEQALVALAPWESLVSDSEVFVFDELGTVSMWLLVFQVCVQGDQTNSWEGDEERQALPQLGTATLKRKQNFPSRSSDDVIFDTKQ
jgi:hypothetical protein